MTVPTKNLLVSGSPGVGKTSLIKEATAPYRDLISGFYTEQVLEGGKRLGFNIIAFDGKEAVLASKAMASPARLNKYGVDLKALEEIGVRAIERPPASVKVIVIDEIGAMESLSERFRSAALARLQGPTPVLATVRNGTHDFSDMVRRLDRTWILRLRRDNYFSVKREVDAWLRAQFD